MVMVTRDFYMFFGAWKQNKLVEEGTLACSLLGKTTPRPTFLFTKSDQISEIGSVFLSTKRTKVKLTTS